MPKGYLNKDIQKLRNQDKMLLQQLQSGQALQGGVQKSFEDRPSNNPIKNALLDVKDLGQGISTVASMFPSLVKELPGFIQGIQSGQIKPQQVVNTAKNVGKAVVKGFAENYGQEAGLNAQNFIKSFVKHPMNVLDVLPAAGLVSKATRGTSNLSKVVSGLGKAGKSFDAMGEIARNTSKTFKPTNAEQLKNIVSGVKSTTEPDSFIKFATKSGANQYGKYKGAGELKDIKSLTPGQQHTFGHVYGEQLKGLKPEQQTQIINNAKEAFGVKSLKDIPDEQLSILVDAVRKQVPTKEVNSVDLLTSLKSTNPRVPDDKYYLPQGLKFLGQSKKLFTGSVLPSASWGIGNRFGDLYHLITGGYNPAEIAAKGVNPAYQGLSKGNDLGGFFKQAAVVKDADKLTNVDKYIDAYTKLAQPVFNLEGKFDTATRQGVLAKELENMAKSNLGRRASKEAILSETQKLAKRQPSYDEAIKGVKQTLGDYRTFSEKQPIIDALFPLAYKWGRESAKVAAHQPIRNPLGYGALKATSELGQDVQNQQAQAAKMLGYDIPEYAKGGFIVGQDDEGRPQIFNSGKLLPITTVADNASIANDLTEGNLQGLLGRLNPALSIPVQASTGKNWVGRPLTSPNIETDYRGNRYAMNPETQEATQLQEGQLPPGEALNFIGSSIARQYTPLGLLERLMPYRSYDTRILEPNSDAKAKPGSSLIRNLGLGSYAQAYKTYTPDTSRLWEQYNMKRGY